ncbi:MAG: response regulator, partial [Paludibacter sp.]
SLLLDNNKLWIGTFSRGVDIFDLKTRTFKNFQHRRNDSKSVCDNAIYAIYKDSLGDIYVGTAWGLSKYDRTSDSFSIIDEIGPMAHIFNILEDSHGYLWVATYNAGVFRLNLQTKKWDHYTHNTNDPKTISGNSVISLFEDRKRILWFGTEGNGLCSFNPKSETFTAFDPENKYLPNPVIYAIQQDEFDNFWIASNAGLVRINPYTKKNRFVFTKADGLQSNQFNFRSSLRARDGKMYFGGINGFNAFYPKDIVENDFVPEVRIVDFKLFNRRVNVTDDKSPLSSPIYDLDELSLKYNQNTFSFSFAALSYEAPDKNRYTYFLEGVDKEWNIIESGNNTASYTNLLPGKYILRVKGSNTDELWNKQETTLVIKILPPFWQTGFAYFMYILIIILTLYWLFRRWIRRISNINEEKIRVIHEKQEKESYLTKINFFTNISHEIRTPLSLIKLPLERIIKSGDGTEKTKNYLSTIDKNTDYLLNLINQLLDFRKTEETEFKLNIKSCDIIALSWNLYARFKNTAEIKNIDFEIDVPENDMEVGIDGEAFNKIISNLLSNALKYAKSKVLFELKDFDEDFEIRISDDGKGISEQEKKKIFDLFYQSDDSEMGTGIGLALAKALVEKHQGTLKFEKNMPEGSVFIISIPKSKVKHEDLPKNEVDVVLIDNEYKKHFQSEQKIDTIDEKNVKLLLVDDNEELLNITTDYLKDYYQIFVATNGEEALSILSEEMIDIVVSDVMMPVMDGYQLCEIIKNTNQYSHIPVILLTAKTNVESKIIGLEFGSDAYLEKPFSLEHLYTQIMNLLASRQHLRELFASSPLMSSVEIAISPRDKLYIEQLNNEIEKHLLDTNFSIDTLSDFMNMSRSNFYRKIKSISGMSPNDYMKTIRLKKAAEMLMSQEYRINEVYEQSGFSSSSYFAKCFKEQFGVLPREFVQKSAKTENKEESST